MLVPKKISASRSIFMMVVITLIISVIGYLVYKTFIQEEEVIDENSQSISKEIDQFDRIETDFSNDFIYQKPYTNLIQNGVLPVKPSVNGRSNPFAEIPFSLLDS